MTFFEIKGFTNYQVSSNGFVKSKKRVVLIGGFPRVRKERIMNQFITRYGYSFVRIVNDEGDAKNIFVHRIVASALISNPLSKPQVNHIDGNKLNNIISNLEWVTPSENQIHAYKAGLQNQNGTRNHMAKISENDVVNIRKMYASGMRCSAIAKIYGTGKSNIWSVATRKTWKHV